MSRLLALVVLAGGLVAAGGLGLAGCSLGQGTGTAAGELFVEPCTDSSSIGERGVPAPFDLRPSYFVADLVNDLQRPEPKNRVFIRIQATGNVINEADGIFLSVADARQVALGIGQPLEVGPVSNVRGTLILRQSCPRAPVQMELDGTATFSFFGREDLGAEVPVDYRVQFGDRIAATFDFAVVDRRVIGLGGLGGVSPSPSVGGRLAGDFDFVVRQGRAAQAYP
jgi:hypothetical protein